MLGKYNYSLIYIILYTEHIYRSVMLLLFHLLQILFDKKKNIRKYIDTFELLIILINKQKVHIKMSAIFCEIPVFIITLIHIYVWMFVSQLLRFALQELSVYPNNIFTFFYTRLSKPSFFLNIV